MRIFHGWWIVVAAFLNLFFVVGVLFYGFPVFYPSLISSLGFTRAQVTTGFLLGFVVVAVPAALMAGALVDRLGARKVICAGIGLVGVPLILMGHMNRLWEFYALCVAVVVGYVLTGPIPNQVLITNWFQKKRGRAMGYAYLGLGLGGVLSPLAVHFLVRTVGWRHAFHIVGVVVLVVLYPVGLLITRSRPSEMGLLPDGLPATSEVPIAPPGTVANLWTGGELKSALGSRNFWLLLTGCTLTIGAIGAVTQHLVLHLGDQGYSLGTASRVSSTALGVSLLGRVVAGHMADHYSRKNLMVLFYGLLSIAIPLLLFAQLPLAAWSFAGVFGFALGADYMLVPLLTAECFGLQNLAKLLALIVSGYSLGQWIAPWLAGRIFDAYHSYNLAWGVMASAALLGAAAIRAVSLPKAHS